LIGDGPERSGLEDLVRELEIEEKVYFLGKQDAVEDLLAISDLFMLTSEHESFGLSALEAMACSVPVVSSNAGGLPEVNIEGYSGFNCPVGNVQAFIEASLKILSNNEQHAQFKSNAYKQSMKFELGKILPMYESVYWKTLNKI
ncbi:MAG TPA: glycosyltransferase, partial [Saprospiraceae bacterium]|nr:glycosyltransferase [Saprospiraceae bacterium]